LLYIFLYAETWQNGAVKLNVREPVTFRIPYQLPQVGHGIASKECSHSDPREGRGDEPLSANKNSESSINLPRQGLELLTQLGTGWWGGGSKNNSRKLNVISWLTIFIAIIHS
jgi:hypothetical protein